MNKLENKIKRLSDSLLESKTKRKRAKLFDVYLNDWGIGRFTIQKRKELKQLLAKYNLELIDPDTSEIYEVDSIRRYDDVVVRYVANYDSPVAVENPFYFVVKVEKGYPSGRPYHFQLDAFQKLSEFYREDNKSGLLVLPTGAGKTFTAVRWLLSNVTNKGKKIIWVAHRHELLEQVANEIKKHSYKSVVTGRSEFSVHLVSGAHDRAIAIGKDDDIIIASVQTLNRNISVLINNFLEHNDDVFVVVDEAHHAVAKTYRTLIDTVKANVLNFNILGLTATPYRTFESEKTYLSKIFYYKPIYSKDLRDLIISGILAKPNVVPVETGEYFRKSDFSENELEQINSNFDLPENIAQEIASRKERNRLIVRHYIENKERYGQTLIFATNRNNAFVLDTLLKDRGIKSAVIISGIENFIGIEVDKENNRKAIELFRKKELDVLVNVNILTEGTDLPSAKTVFLTRPTRSKTLMTQMVGRALRGPKAGGTEEAYIVNFIDNWDGLIAWQNPQQLFVDENEIRDSESSYKRESEVRFISIELLKQFIRLADDTVSTEELESYPSIMRIPVGWYSFEIEQPGHNENLDFISCRVLVFEQHKEAFDSLSNELEMLYERFDYDKNGVLDEYELSDLLEEVKSRYFDTLEYPEPRINDNDLRSILIYYDQYKSMPKYFSFEQREQYDIKKLVAHVIDNNMTSKQEAEFLKSEWEGEDGKSIWKDFYSGNFKYFKRDFENERNKILYPEEYSMSNKIPEIVYKKETLEDSPLHEWPEDLRREMREKVFEKWNREHPEQRIEQKDRWMYQIDHIIPRAKGGKTVLENLQPLLTYKNKIKSDRT